MQEASTLARPVEMIVICTDAGGSPCAYRTIFKLTDRQYAVGEHYALAELEALDHGYEGPVIVVDEQEQLFKQLAPCVPPASRQPESSRH